MQKFFRGHRVKIAKTLSPEMDHFEKDCEAIVEYSYTDEYGGHEDDNPEYSLLLLIGDETMWYTVSWYDEQYLTLINKNRDAGEKILQKYKIICDEDDIEE